MAGPLWVTEGFMGDPDFHDLKPGGWEAGNPYARRYGLDATEIRPMFAVENVRQLSQVELLSACVA